MWNDASELYPLVPLGLRAVEKDCVGAASSGDSAWATVSAVSDECLYRASVCEKQGYFQKVTKSSRLDARDPTVSYHMSNRTYNQFFASILFLATTTNHILHPPSISRKQNLKGVRLRSLKESIC